MMEAANGDVVKQKCANGTYRAVSRGRSDP